MFAKVYSGDVPTSPKMIPIALQQTPSIYQVACTLECKGLQHENGQRLARATVVYS